MFSLYIITGEFSRPETWVLISLFLSLSISSSVHMHVLSCAQLAVCDPISAFSPSITSFVLAPRPPASPPAYFPTFYDAFFTATVNRLCETCDKRLLSLYTKRPAHGHAVLPAPALSAVPLGPVVSGAELESARDRVRALEVELSRRTEEASTLKTGIGFLRARMCICIYTCMSVFPCIHVYLSTYACV